MKKKFNKKLLTFGILGLFAMALVTGALLTYYGQIIGKAQVEQSVIVKLGTTPCGDTGCEYDIGDSPAYGGSSYVKLMEVINRANTQIPIKFETIAKKCAGSGYGSCEVDASDVISTRYYGVLNLENKNPSGWAVIPGDDIEATLKYDLVSPTFDYELEAKGLQTSTSYVLIYYADKQDRFANWGGDNPGALITTFTTDASGYKLISGSENINMNLPHSDDWNLDAEPDYCDNHNSYDDFDLCGGAKIWIVPSNEYDSGTKTVSWGNPGNYLYETDMIDYSDTNVDGEKLWMNTGEIVVSVENTFDPATEPGYYKITTRVVPPA